MDGTRISFAAAVLTLSDSGSRGERKDESGPAAAARIARIGGKVKATALLPDEREQIAAQLKAWCRPEAGIDLILTTGGTGFSARDVTPEATQDVITRPVPGLAEEMRRAGRAHSPMAVLSRGVCGIRGQTLLLNLPGSVRGVTESLDAVLPVLPHGIRLLKGDTGHSHFDSHQKPRVYAGENKEGFLQMKWIQNPSVNKARMHTLLDDVDSSAVMRYHKLFPSYTKPPLVHLPALAARLGVGDLAVKDESKRFGLNAFKVLGASFAIGNCLCQMLHKNIADVTLDELKQENTRAALGEITFATATDGNHGRGMAWTAKQLGYQAVVYMPAGSTQRRLDHILELGAKATITAMNYDDTVRFVAKEAKKNHWTVVQDTAWEGYEDVPRWIMQGYSTTAQEVLDDLAGKAPTHVFLQAGVGAFASVMAAAFTRAYPENPPKIIVAEPDQADCYYRSIAAGKKTAVTGSMQTIMCGLACGEPNPIGWEILRRYGDCYLSAPDWVSACGMRLLGNPLAGDTRIVSGESGAVTAGALAVIMTRPEFSGLKKTLGLNESSRVVLYSTEGDTDPVVYRDIVWNGAYPTPKAEGEKNGI